MSTKGKAAIAGLGITTMGRVYGRDAADLAAEAIALALADAGLNKDDLDGLLINAGAAANLSPYTMGELGFKRLRLLNHMNAFGATAASMVQFAALAIGAGMAECVACVFADAPLAPDRTAGDVYGRRPSPAGMDGLNQAYGLTATTARYALAARRHMELYGTTSAQFGAVAVATRAWATRNPRAQLRTPMTLADHQNSRMVADPLRLYDCCLVSNGGVAVIVTSAERARALARPPVYIWGMGQGHQSNPPREGFDPPTATPAALSGRTAFAMAGLSPRDVTVCELYDCYTFTVITTLEDYGFCPKGEGGPFVSDGKLGPGGALPTNTGGGQLSSYYMWGMTPLSEAVIQARGDGGERQAPRRDVILVSGNGGVLNFHATLILSPHPA